VPVGREDALDTAAARAIEEGSVVVAPVEEAGEVEGVEEAEEAGLAVGTFFMGVGVSALRGLEV
jgi:hypothetical protein